MESITKIEVTITGELAELYNLMFEATSGSESPSQINRAVLETGLVHHATMLKALELIGGDSATRVDQIIAGMSDQTIMADLFKMAADYWQGQTGTGTFELE
jgi:hypothetical protein